MNIEGFMSYNSVTDSLLASQRHYLPTPKPTKISNDTMPQTKHIDEKHADTASVRSTSTISSLKSLLHKKHSKPDKPKPTNAAKASERLIAHEARATYFALK